MVKLAQLNSKAGIIPYQLLILFSFLVTSPNYAQQSPSIKWQKYLNGTGKCIIQTLDGGYAIVGGISSRDSSVTGYHPSLDTVHPTNDIWIVKLNSSTEVEWVKCLGGSGDDIGNSIIQTSDGGYAIAGYTNSRDGDVSGNNSGNADVEGWVVKIDSLGIIEWSKSFGTTNPKPNQGYVYPFSIIQNSRGGFIIAGSEIFTSEGCYPGSTDAFVIELNSSGNLLWQKCYGGTNVDEAFSIIQTFDGGYCFAGETSSTDGLVSGYHIDSTNRYSTDIWLVKINSQGSLIWQKCLGGNSNDWAQTVVQTNDSCFVIGGVTSSNDGDVSGNHGRSDAWVVKVNSSGSIIWQKCLGGKFGDEAFSMIKVSDGGFVIAGVTSSDDGDISGYHPSLDSTHSRTKDVWVVRIDSIGAFQWQKCLGGSGDDQAYSITGTKDGGYILTGFTNSTDGDISINHHDSDMWVVKLEEKSNGVETGFFGSNSPPYQVFKIYPNPSSEQVHLQMRGEQTVKDIKFYDVTGRALTIDYDLDGNSATVNVYSLMTGIYVARLTFSYNDYKGTFSLPLIVQH